MTDQEQTTRKVSIIIQERAAEREVVEFALAKEEESILAAFVHFARELSETHILQHGDWGELNLQFLDGRTKENVRVPHVHHIESFLMRLQPFILQGESTYLPKVANAILSKRIANERFRRLLEQYRDIFSGRNQRENVFNVTVIGPEKESFSMFSAQILELWFDAFYFHKDLARQQELLELIKPMGIEHATFHWLCFLQERVVAIVGLAEVLRFVLRNEDKTLALRVGPRGSQYVKRADVGMEGASDSPET